MSNNTVINSARFFAIKPKLSKSSDNAKGVALYRQTSQSNQPEQLVKQIISNCPQQQRQRIADQFVAEAGEEGLNEIARSPDGQHALKTIYTYASKDTAAYMHQIHARQGTTAVDYTSSNNKLTGFFDQYNNIIQPKNDLIDPAPCDEPQDPHTGYWTQLEDETLFVDGASYKDIDQGRVGDCNFLATLASIAKSDPEYIKNMITENQDGTYTVRLYDTNGKSKHITVDGELFRTGPLNRQTYYANVTDQGEIWPAIVEKAYAQMKGGYDNISSKSSEENILALTGKKSFRARNDRYNQDFLYTTISKAISKGDPVIASSFDHNESYAYHNLVPNHAYSILDIRTDNSGQRWITLRNPWARKEFRGTEYTTDIYRPRWDRSLTPNDNDGVFRMKFEDYCRLFHSTTMTRSTDALIPDDPSP